MLRNLPNEHLLLIASSLVEVDINAFSRINDRFHAVLTPYLYERDAKTTRMPPCFDGTTIRSNDCRMWLFKSTADDPSNRSGLVSRMPGTKKRKFAKSISCSCGT